MLQLEEQKKEFDVEILNYSSIEQMIKVWDGEITIISPSQDIPDRCYIVFEKKR